MGGKSQPAPDYSAMAAATQRGIDVAEKLGTRQMDFAQRQYEEMKPLAERVAATQIAAQNQRPSRLPRRRTTHQQDRDRGQQRRGGEPSPSVRPACVHQFVHRQWLQPA